MEEDHEHKYVCKFCNQSFHSGRSLGGHMRCHIITTSAETDEKINSSNMGYGLRENPKKSWRFSDSNHSISGQENHCKVCGKGFQSLRALSGHMRHHSQREREGNYCKECGKGFGSLKALFGHMRCHSEIFRVDNQSDDDTAGLTRRKRSRSMRYKITVNSSFSNLNASSSATGIDQELEDVAMCLMMLSRDVGNWGGLNFEAKSSNHNKPITKNEGGNFVCNSDLTLKIKKPIATNWGNVLFGKEESEFGNTGSVIGSEEEKKIELEVSIDGFFRSDELKKPKLEDESGVDLSDTDEVKIKPTEVELGKDSTDETGTDRAGLESAKSNLRKKATFDAYDPELGGSSCTKMKFASDSKDFNGSRKKGKYKCRTCSKVFHSHQALGGHRASHKTIRSSSASKIESCGKGIQTNHFPDIEANCKLVKLECTDNSANQEGGGATVTSYELQKSSKGHECPICFKVFASEQDLGGHMGAHFVGNTEIRVEQTIMKQEHPDIDDLFNLNLPATLEEEATGHVGFKPWWVGSDHEHEPLVGLISN